MTRSTAIGVHQAGRAWRSKESAANIREEGCVSEALSRTASDGVMVADKKDRMERYDTQHALKYCQRKLAAGVDRDTRLALRTYHPIFSTSAAEAVPAGGEAATIVQNQQQLQQQRQRQHSPLGCLFRPELDKAEVVAVVSEMVCQPGFTLGPGDERRLLKSVRTGRVDIRCMSRLLRWLSGERVGRGLRKHGLEFIGPKGLEATEPYTTGQGMQHLVREVVAGGHRAGTHFIVCFSSRFDACSSAIAGVLVNASCPLSGSVSESLGLESGSHLAGDRYSGGGALSEDTRTPSTCSWSSDTDEDVTASVPLSPAAAAAAAVNGRCTASAAGADMRADGVVSSGSSSSIAGGSAQGHGDLVALLLDEMPKHCRRTGVHVDGGGSKTGCVADDSDGGVYGMQVEEWVEAYGECDGPMLAAWIFPGSNHRRPATRRNN